MMPYLSYFGNLDTWQQLIKTQIVSVHEDVMYRFFPKGMLNRIAILSSQGLLFLSIPIQGGRKNKSPFKDTQIDYSQAWQIHHYKSIKSCYGKAPFWNEYEADIQKIYTLSPIFLTDWNKLIFEWIAGLLRLKLNYLVTTITDYPAIQTELQPYVQIFGNRFYHEVFILDLILNQGEREAKKYLSSP